LARPCGVRCYGQWSVSWPHIHLVSCTGTQAQGIESIAAKLAVRCPALAWRSARVVFLVEEAGGLCWPERGFFHNVVPLCWPCALAGKGGGSFGCSCRGSWQRELQLIAFRPAWFAWHRDYPLAPWPCSSRPLIASHAQTGVWWSLSLVKFR
jgi:hypothetical protein